MRHKRLPRPRERNRLHDSADMTNVVYGSDKKSTSSTCGRPIGKPTPLVIFIHGGGFGGGLKTTFVQN